MKTKEDKRKPIASALLEGTTECTELTEILTLALVLLVPKVEELGGPKEKANFRI